MCSNDSNNKADLVAIDEFVMLPEMPIMACYVCEEGSVDKAECVMQGVHSCMNNTESR